MNNHSTIECRKEICTSCKREGHHHSRCRSKQKEKIHATTFQDTSSQAQDDTRTEYSESRSTVSQNSRYNFSTNVVSFHSVSLNENDVLLDSGASAHVVSHHSEQNMHNIGNIPEQLGKTINSSTKINKVGDLTLINHKNRPVTVKNVYILKTESKTALLSITQLIEQGYIVEFKDKNFIIKKGNKEAFLAFRKNRLYQILEGNINTNSIQELENWHRLFGHCSKESLLKTLKQYKLPIVNIPKNWFCEVCSRTKQTRNPVFKTKTYNSTRPLDIRCTDTVKLNRSKTAKVGFVLVTCAFSKCRFIKTFHRIKEATNLLIEILKNI
eukprot:snap_masked-scaffold_2-processed-gene-17.35-mRNA-1 protein AED:1.00 eAED:1.00 QI:0/-1/0/0/-1/1/1/0/325